MKVKYKELSDYLISEHSAYLEEKELEQIFKVVVRSIVKSILEL